jgi:Zn-dependent protease with chaperone function
MMQYSNPQIPEGINTSQSHPLKEFFILTGGVIAIVVISFYLLIVTVDFFADKIPFAWEQSIPLDALLEEETTDALPYLENLVHDVAEDMSLPDGMQVTLHYVNSNTVNAFATLGGHMVLHRGLLEKLHSEDELVTVIAHEMAHLKYRHPISSASHSLLAMMLLSMFTSSADGVLNRLMGTSGLLTLMKFSRDYEYRADAAAVDVLLRRYGHAQGAVALFDVFKPQHGEDEPLEFLNTHPLTERRIQRTLNLAQQSGLSADRLLNKKMQPLPVEFTDWLAAQSE